MENRGSRAVISVFFEELGGIEESYYLNFSCRIEERDDFFYLDYSPALASALSEEKGTLEYGGNSFKLKFTGDTRPYLLIRLSPKRYRKTNIPHCPGPGSKLGYSYLSLFFGADFKA